MKAFYQHAKTTLLLLLAGTLLSCGNNEVEYTGIIDHRPEGKDGMWVIDGKSFSVTEDVDLDEDEGPITVGTCVELEMDDGDVTEIESRDMAACQAQTQS